MATNATAPPPTRRVIALEDARMWIDDAIAAIAKGDTAAAVYAVHAAVGHATDARDTLVDLLAWSADDEGELVPG